MRINTVLRQSKWFALFACGFVAFSAKAAAQDTDNATELIGHWRKTTTIYYSVKDEHLVFGPDGTVDNWTVTVSGPYEGRTSRTATTTGRWSVEGKLLNASGSLKVGEQVRVELSGLNVERGFIDFVPSGNATQKRPR